MPRVALAIRLVCFLLFAVGMLLIALIDSEDQLWLYGAGVALSLMFGVASVLLHALRWVHGAYVDEIPTKDIHYASGANRVGPAQGDFDSGGVGFGGD